MKTGRLEAFSDGVLAIIITIMVLELKEPESGSLMALKPLIPKFLSYLLSFIYVGIYWNNHHHLFHAIEKVTGGILWSNLALLFSLSLIPFTTAWVGEFHDASIPAALYGVVLFLAASVYAILVKVALKNEGKDSTIGKALSNIKKEYASIALYIAGIIVAFYNPIISFVFYALVAMLWVIPDKRIEKQVQ